MTPWFLIQVGFSSLTFLMRSIKLIEEPSLGKLAAGFHRYQPGWRTATPAAPFYIPVMAPFLVAMGSNRETQ